ncbi:MAG: hypothetical protein IPI01_07655 [Ignavibacteriae bacterium]|nr:hypothetical protein [Ignavibacteriota bacterium]
MSKTMTLLAICCLVVLAGCGASQMSSYTSKNVATEWNITATKSAVTNVITIAINDSVVVSDKPAAFANTIEGKGTYRGHAVHFFSVYNSGVLGIFGTGWETTVLVDNDLAARFKL